MPPGAMVDAGDVAGNPGTLVFWDIVEESLGEATFLWRCREAALEAPDRTPAQVESAIEDRLQGAIDGLCAPDAQAVDRVLGPALDGNGDGNGDGDADGDDLALVAVAAHVLLAAGTEEGAERFGVAFLGSADARLRAMRQGLELVATPGVLVGLSSAVPDAGPAVHAAFLDACAFRALALAPRFGDLMASPSLELQRAAVRLLAHAPQSDREAWLPRALALTDRQVQEAAVTTALIAGARAAWSACRELASAQLHGSDPMLLPLALSGSRRDHDLVCGVLGQSRRQRGALWALGFGGRRSGADACVEMLAQDRHVRLAAEALAAITGLDLQEVGLVAAAPVVVDEEAPSFEDDDLDANLVPAAEDRLPAPDVPGVIRWWNRTRARFDPDTRYLGGRPASVGLVLDALARGPMRRRPALAFELAVRTQGRFQLETRGFLIDQRRRLAAFAAQSYGARSVDTPERPLLQETSSSTARGCGQETGRERGRGR